RGLRRALSARPGLGAQSPHPGCGRDRVVHTGVVGALPAASGPTVPGPPVPQDRAMASRGGSALPGDREPALPGRTGGHRRCRRGDTSGIGRRRRGPRLAGDRMAGPGRLCRRRAGCRVERRARTAAASPSLAPGGAGDHAPDVGHGVHHRCASAAGRPISRSAGACAAVKVLMLVQSPVAGDSRVLREAAALRKAGHDVHVFGRDVPDDFDPGGGVTVGSVARSRGMKPRSAVAASATAASPRTDAPRAANSGPAAPPSVPSFAAGGLKGRALRGARWFLLPEHRELTERTWRTEAGQALAGSGPFDVVHAHDYNTLALSAELAERWSAQLVYDSHELWFDRGLPGRPTPLRSWRGRRKEAQLAARAQAVLTVSDGIADRLRRRGVSEVTVVRNT